MAVQSRASSSLGWRGRASVASVATPAQLLPYHCYIPRCSLLLHLHLHHGGRELLPGITKKSWTLSSWNHINQVTFSFLFQYNIDGSNVNEETVSHLRQRLNVMREICKVTYIISIHQPQPSPYFLYLDIVLCRYLALYGVCGETCV